MANLDNLRRIMPEDFPSESQDTIAMLAEILNPFMTQINDAFNNNINFDNINQEVKDLVVYVDTNGNPVTAAVGSTTLKSLKLKLDRNIKVKGVLPIRCKNKTDSTNYPTANPFIDWVVSGQILTINKIKGLQLNEKYEMSILIIYDS
jgi:hypothetical protein